MIRAVLIFNNSGKPRLLKFYERVVSQNFFRLLFASHSWFMTTSYSFLPRWFFVWFVERYLYFIRTGEQKICLFSIMFTILLYFLPQSHGIYSLNSCLNYLIRSVLFRIDALISLNLVKFCVFISSQKIYNRGFFVKFSLLYLNVMKTSVISSKAEALFSLKMIVELFIVTTLLCTLFSVSMQRRAS